MHYAAVHDYLISCACRLTVYDSFIRRMVSVSAKEHFMILAKIFGSFLCWIFSEINRNPTVDVFEASLKEENTFYIDTSGCMNQAQHIFKTNEWDNLIKVKGFSVKGKRMWVLIYWDFTAYKNYCSDYFYANIINWRFWCTWHFKFYLLFFPL